MHQTREKLSYHSASGLGIVSAGSKVSHAKRVCVVSSRETDESDSLAYAEMRVIITRLIWNFDLALDERSRNWLDQKMFTMWEKPDLLVKLTPVVRGA
jgi:hypothetical protein